MGKVDNAVSWALATANSAAHGYDQGNRWGPDYDCASFVISAFQQAGIPVKTAGATYTGNMRSVFLRCGFKDVTLSVSLPTGAGLQRGDVLLNPAAHTALALGSGRIVAARINEKGQILGGRPGDQTGAEIAVGNYYNYPWTYVLRYTEQQVPAAESSAAAEDLPETYTVQAGDTLSGISARFHVPLADLVRINSIQIPDRIYVGQTIKLKDGTAASPVPVSAATVSGGSSGNTYTVQRGDTLWGIALRHLGNGVLWHQLAELNGIKAPWILQQGQVLKLP